MNRNPFCNNRLNIGVLINQMEGANQEPLWKALIGYAERQDFNLIFYEGRSLKSPAYDDIQYNVVFDIVNPDHLDGLICTTGAIINFSGAEVFLEYLKTFSGIPVVSLSVVLPGIPSILVDNKSGIRDAVTHLVKEHGMSRIAFVRGPETNPEAEARFEGYKEVLSENGIPLDPALVLPGDFSWAAGLEAAKYFTDKNRPDTEAIVFANDNMANSFCGAFTQYGGKVPGNMAVIGFDDIENSRYMNPPLTTVSQPLEEMVRLACKNILDNIRDGTGIPPVQSLSAALVVRQTCGCLPVTPSSQRKFLLESVAGRSPDQADSVPEVFVAAFSPVVPSARREQSKSALVQIGEAFLNSLKNRQENRDLIALINRLLMDSVPEKFKEAEWYEAAQSAQNALLAVYPSREDQNGILDIFADIQALIRDTQHRVSGEARVRTETSIWILRSIMRQVNSAFNFEKIFEVIVREFPALGIPGCVIGLYDMEPEARTGPDWTVPRDSRLGLAFDESGLIRDLSRPLGYKTRDLVPEGILSRNSRHTLIVQPLFLATRHFGIIVFEMGTHFITAYDTLREQIGIALNATQLMEEERRAEDKLKTALVELENFNQVLHEQSLKDDLTGLYNRRGIYFIGEHHLKIAEQNATPFVLFFADMDGLKTINDRYGHGEGDAAIKCCSEILRVSFRQGDVIGRFGGDEFVVLAAECKPSEIETIKARMAENTSRLNGIMGKPYQVRFTVGFHTFQPGAGMTLNEIMSKADHMLYEEKRKKAGNAPENG